jgi:superfamily II DNA or RNA helicase/diadenosine tetraphosphate (Ap4A) HIT family hydrolase
MTELCPFCDPVRPEVLFEDDLVIAAYDGFPVADGHCLVIPKRHYSSWFEATRAEQLAILDAIDRCKKIVEADFTPDGWNVGINIGKAAGQTIAHLHVHLIPRYLSDVSDPTGGVRAVIPSKANYLQPKPDTGTLKRLITGDSDELLPHFKLAIENADSIDFASAFIMQSGVDLLWETLVDFINRGGKARILTGDYLNYTDPAALYKLLDLGPSVNLRVYMSGGQSFHPKAYIFHKRESGITAFVGSSNLSKSALTNGVEWNYRVLSNDDTQTSELVNSFQNLFDHSKTRNVTSDWIDEYQAKRGDQPLLAPVAVDLDDKREVPEPHKIQQQALSALKHTRSIGNKAGLVVLATGLGKTWLSAFDSNAPEFSKVLFVAHREEILNQSLATFRKIRPQANFGKYTGTDKHPDADILFASIQTLSRTKHLEQFTRDAFDYIIVDEFHHAAAKSYRKLINYFTPKFLLGLTATPERTDGADLLALCQDNIVFNNDMLIGIKEALLCPFQYYGVPDDIDYETIPWRSKRFDEAKLTEAVATKKRAQNALEQLRDKGGKRALGFCCSIRHADFMAKYFCDHGVKAVAVHSEPSSYPRARAIDELASGDLDIVFAVDIFNEGLDVPSIDTVLMLRPTQSSIIWLQQFGRGLRKLEGKSHLNVIDYIGNHRSFLVKIQSMLNPFIDGVVSDAEIALALRRLENNELELPDKCHVTYELETRNIIAGLLRSRDSDDAILTFYRDYFERNEYRPSAGDLYRAGYNPRALRSSFGSWLGFVHSMNGFSNDEDSAYRSLRTFLDSLESTPMTKSYKMLLLMALLNLDALPGSVHIDQLTREFQIVAQRSAILARDVGAALHDLKDLRKSLEKNPIAAWTAGKGTGGVSYFRYDNSTLTFLPDLSDQNRESLQLLVRELIDWRLAEYINRDQSNQPQKFIGRIIHAAGKPIIKLPDRSKHDYVPKDWVHILVDDQRYYANFVKEFINVVRTDPHDDENHLATLLRGWFGEDVGKPGTDFKVEFESFGEFYRMSPKTRSTESSADLRWQHYMRESIPPLFGEEFNTGSWRQGFVVKDNNVFLLVTLDKTDHDADHQYQDFFTSSSIFKWQSQNRTKQESSHGKIIAQHKALGMFVHLFIRTQKRFNGKAAPFIYCGEVDFVSWEGELPISVTWKLREPVPATLRDRLGVPLDDD